MPTFPITHPRAPHIYIPAGVAYSSYPSLYILDTEWLAHSPLDAYDRGWVNVGTSSMSLRHCCPSGICLSNAIPLTLLTITIKYYTNTLFGLVSGKSCSPGKLERRLVLGKCRASDGPEGVRPGPVLKQGARPHGVTY